MRGRPPKTFVVPSRRIWIDADHCAASTLQVLYRMAQLRRLAITVVSSKSQSWPESAYIRGVVLAEGFDTVVARIEAMQAAGDYVITDDPGLAATSRRKGIAVLDSHGANPVDDSKDAPPPLASFLAQQQALPYQGLMSVLLRKDQQLFALRFDHLLSRAARQAQAALAARVAAQAKDKAAAELFD